MGAALDARCVGHCWNEGGKDHSPDELLVAAIRADDADGARRALVYGASPDGGSDPQQTSLIPSEYRATPRGSSSSRPDSLLPHIPDRPLFLAAILSTEDVVKALVEGQAEVNLANDDGWTALCFAARRGHRPICHLLVRKMSDPHKKDNCGLNALDHALNLETRKEMQHALVSIQDRLPVNGFTKVCRDIVEFGDFTFVNSKDQFGNTVLHYAIRRQFRQVALAILDSALFAEVNAEGRWKRTALHLAAAEGSVELTHAIIGCKGFAAINSADEFGRTALSYARLKGYQDVARAIQAAGGYEFD